MCYSANAALNKPRDVSLRSLLRYLAFCFVGLRAKITQYDNVFMSILAIYVGNNSGCKYIIFPGVAEKIFWAVLFWITMFTAMQSFSFLAAILDRSTKHISLPSQPLPLKLQNGGREPGLMDRASLADFQLQIDLPNKINTKI